MPTVVRTLSGRAQVLFGAKGAQVGRICMDYCMVDITDLPEVGPGEPVVIFGRQGDEQILADELAALTGAINYEYSARFCPMPRYYKYQT